MSVVSKAEKTSGKGDVWRFIESTCMKIYLYKALVWRFINKQMEKSKSMGKYGP